MINRSSRVERIGPQPSKIPPGGGTAGEGEHHGKTVYVVYNARVDEFARTFGHATSFTENAVLNLACLVDDWQGAADETVFDDLDKATDYYNRLTCSAGYDDRNRQMLLYWSDVVELCREVRDYDEDGGWECDDYDVLLAKAGSIRVTYRVERVDKDGRSVYPDVYETIREAEDVAQEYYDSDSESDPDTYYSLDRIHYYVIDVLEEA